ncbi:MAG TPA: hypothetical protein VFF52_15410, partial [Isosphaeraceae bacterium]|nr:hypothetical protein [Isosphaeraceae bacterium]
LWIKGEPAHRSYWDIPIFYPARNIAAHSDTLLTVAPLYWGYRVLGFLPDTAFQLWMLTVSVLNYLAGYWLLRDGFRRGVPGSIGGAFLFAFAAARVNEVEHQQLAPQFYTVATLMALLRIFRDRPRPPAAAFAWWSIAGLSLAAQFYTSFYLGWFLVLALEFAAIWGLILPRYRPILIGVIRQQWPAMGWAAVVSALAIWPLLAHYLLAANESGLRDYHVEVVMSVPDWRAWVYLGAESWLFGWMPRLGLFHGLMMEQSKRHGLGVATTVLCLAGLHARRHEPAVRLAGLVMLSLLLALTRFHRQFFEGILLGVWLICAVELAWRDRPGADRRALGWLVLLLSPAVFPGEATGQALFVAAFIFLTGALPSGATRNACQLVIAVALLGLPFWISHGHRRLALAVAGCSLLVAQVKPLLTKQGPAPRSLFLAGAVVVASLWIFPDDILYWRCVAHLVPGGQALRAVARGLLLTIIPAALGLACFFDQPWERPRPLALALGLGLLCVLEQGVTTSSFDKATQRRAVADLARRVNPRWRCFYHYFHTSSRGPETPVNEHHLQAMWAGLQTGIPTVNGYSGVSPRGWLPLYHADIAQDRDRVELDLALNDWARRHAFPVEEIGRVAGHD